MALTAVLGFSTHFLAKRTKPKVSTKVRKGGHRAGVPLLPGGLVIIALATGGYRAGPRLASYIAPPPVDFSERIESGPFRPMSTNPPPPPPGVPDPVLSTPKTIRLTDTPTINAHLTNEVIGEVTAKLGCLKCSMVPDGDVTKSGLGTEEWSWTLEPKELGTLVVSGTFKSRFGQNIVTALIDVRDAYGFTEYWHRIVSIGTAILSFVGLAGLVALFNWALNSFKKSTKPEAGQT